MASYRIVYDVEVRRQLAAIDRKYHSLIRRTIEQQLSHQSGVETRNRKPLQRSASLGADWELRCWAKQSLPRALPHRRHR